MNSVKSLIVLGLGGLAALYLINPTAGFLEFLPDNLPLVGNLDEATATAILIAAVRYFGYDITSLFKRDDRQTVVDSRTNERKERI